MAQVPVRFDDFELDRAACELRRGGVAVPLQRIPLELLFLLVERSGSVVTRDEIIERVWGRGVFVDSENSINTAVRKLRRALDDNAEAPRFVATVPARGYRFIARILERDPRTSDEHGPRAGAAMVGRERELSMLLAGLDAAAAGAGRLFLISGEPGVGKTRLANEAAAAAAARGMPPMVGHCSEYGEAVAYLPFVEILENVIDRAPGADSVRAAFGEQARELARLLPKLRDLLPDLVPPLDLSPAQARRLLFNSFFIFAARVAARHPALIVLEDLQWADDSTLSLLDYLAQRLSGVPLVIIATFRDEALGHGDAFAAVLESLVRQRLAERIALKCLTQDGVAAMIRGLSGKPPPAEIVEPIFAETGGNPFFVEELFRHLEEENRLYDSSGEFRTGLAVGEDEAPPGVRLVVGRRLERLSEPARQNLATAATIGRVFSFDLLRAACRTDEGLLLEHIEEAERAGLVASCAGTANPRFQFSHELIRQAVIAAMSAVRRQRAHLEVAEAIEAGGGADWDSAVSSRRYNLAAELAIRYARGGNPLKALSYAARAVRELAAVGSNAEAIAHFEHGLELLGRIADPDQRMNLEMNLRIAAIGMLGDTRGFASPDAERSNLRAMELSQRPGVYWKKTWLALYGVLFIYLTRPDVAKACETATNLVALAEPQGSADHVADANTYLACARMYSGDFQEADRHFERGWTLMESSVNSDDAPTPERVGKLLQHRELLWAEGTPQNNRGLSALNLWFLGHPRDAMVRIAIATDIAHLGVKTMLADIHGFAAYLYELLREPELMRERARARLEISEEAGYAAGRALSEIYLGYADALAGDEARGLARMQGSLAELRATGFEAGTSYYLALVAKVYARMNRFDEALQAIDESFSLIERSGQRNYEAEINRIKGDLLLARNRADAAAAERSFRTAIEIARAQCAKSWELRAATSLAKLLGRTDRRGEARSILAGVYEWFTEGFETPDLKDARALLGRLRL